MATHQPPPRQVGQTVWFGIGCFHFGYQKPVPYTFRRQDYLGDLQRALEGIPAITDVVIDIPDLIPDEAEVEITTEPGGLEKGEGSFPYFSFGWVRFRIYIPTRVQAELANKFAPESTGTENFSVYIDYTYEGPVAYVTLDSPVSGDRDPSTAVQIVREFLRRELNAKGGPIRFECIGPSPFHADCSLTLLPATGPGKGNFVGKRIPLHGYDRLEFTSNHAEHDIVTEAAEELFRELDHELGYFYEIHATELEAMNLWEGIEGQVALLLEPLRQPRAWKRVVSRIRRSSKLHDVFTALINFDVSRTFVISKLDQGYRSTYAAGAGFLRHYVDADRADAVDYPTQQITTLVGFLEKRRSKALELFVILIAALVGGVAGAALTNAVKWPGITSDRNPKAFFSRAATVMSPSPAASPVAPSPITTAVPTVQSQRDPSSAKGIELQNLVKVWPTPTASPSVRLELGR